jgi:hypothetical protein
MATLLEAENLIRELDVLAEAEDAARHSYRSFRAKRGMKGKSVERAAQQLGMTVGEIRAGMPAAVPDPEPEEDLGGHVCDECSGRGGDVDCSCGGFGWIDD